VLGKKVTIDDIIHESEKVYNFQRIFNLRMGFGTRRWDYPPYRAMGPVIEVEYEDRAEYYDQVLREEVGVDPTGLNTSEKIQALRRYREQRYDRLVDAVYKRRGWTENGVPTLEKVRSLGIDFPEVVKLVVDNGG
jgi:aldehyde:ferredoxin oxidoreductase